jgi:hypothetical protein
MKAILMLLTFVLVTAAFSLPANAQSDQDQLRGTWSGSWIPDGGVRDALTIEVAQEDGGKLTGRFVTPASVTFTKTTFNPKTRMLLLEATDSASGKRFKLEGKVEGTEIKGTVEAENRRGQVHLIKWTYVPRISGY